MTEPGESGPHTPPPAPAPAALMDDIDAAWHDLWPLLTSLETGDEDGRWTVKDVYAHFGRWDLVTALAIAAHVDGRPAADWDALFSSYAKTNMRWVRQDQGIPLDEARDRARSGHGRLMLTLRGLNNEDWDDYVRAMASDVLEHYSAHLEAPLEFSTGR